MKTAPIQHFDHVLHQCNLSSITRSFITGKLWKIWKWHKMMSSLLWFHILPNTSFCHGQQDMWSFSWRWHQPYTASVIGQNKVYLSFIICDIKLSISIYNNKNTCYCCWLGLRLWRTNDPITMATPVIASVTSQRRCEVSRRRSLGTLSENSAGGELPLLSLCCSLMPQIKNRTSKFYRTSQIEAFLTQKSNKKHHPHIH